MLAGEPNYSINTALGLVGDSVIGRSYCAVPMCQAMCNLYVLPDYFSKLAGNLLSVLQMRKKAQRSNSQGHSYPVFMEQYVIFQVPSNLQSNRQKIRTLVKYKINNNQFLELINLIYQMFQPKNCFPAFLPILFIGLGYAFC